MHNTAPKSDCNVSVQTFIGKEGKQMAVFRLVNSRPYKSDGYSDAMPVNAAMLIAKTLTTERNGTLFIDGLQTDC